MRRVAIALATLCIASVVVAGEPEKLYSDAVLQRVAQEVVAESSREMPESSRPFWTIAAWLAAATLYDIETTFYVREQCDTCDEQNPITAPIVETGRLATYAYSIVVDAAVLYLARRMYARDDPAWRVIPIALAIVHFVAGSWNLYTTTLPPS